MLCSSLFRRKEWISAARALKQPPLLLKERNLEGHDIALPICGDTELFRIKLLASEDTARPAETMQLVERLVHLDGGKRCGIVLLLSGESADARVAGLAGFQIFLFSTHPDLPIFPISSAQDLAPALQSIQAHHAGAQTRNPPPLAPHHRVHELVPYLVNGPRLGETNAHKLSDLADGLGELCGMVHSQEGIDRLVEYLGDEDALRVVEFLTEETVIG